VLEVLLEGSKYLVARKTKVQSCGRNIRFFKTSNALCKTRTKKTAAGDTWQNPHTRHLSLTAKRKRLHHENPEIDLLLSIAIRGSESPGNEEVGFYYFTLLYIVSYVV
jgi:hypothetical protein